MTYFKGLRPYPNAPSFARREHVMLCLLALYSLSKGGVPLTPSPAIIVGLQNLSQGT